MRWGVVVFPGSNDDRDALRVAERRARRRGRARSGTRIATSGASTCVRPARRLLVRRLPPLRRHGALLADHGRRRAATRADGGLVLGICNGFQILCEAGLLPGRAGAQPRRSASSATLVTVRVETRRHAVHLRLPRGRAARAARSSTARAAGWPTRTTLARARARRRSRLPLRRPRRARDAGGEPERRRSATSPACATRRGNVVGLMPHPEHAVERRRLGGEDGLKLFRSAQAWLGARAAARRREPTLVPGPDGARTAVAAEVTAALAAEHGLTRRGVRSASSTLLGRPPTFEELGVFAVMWSEHCSLQELARAPAAAARPRARRCCRARARTPARVDIGDGLAAVFKIESHNHPSFIEPFQGAATGVGGILRDVFTMGARPVAILDSLRFGSRRPSADAVPRARRRRRHRRTTATASACPPSAATSYFDAGYDGNILVNAFTLGIARRDRLFRAKAGGRRQPGHLRRLADGPRRHPRREPARVGRVRRDVARRSGPTVQVGDPFTEKLLLEACLELMRDGPHRRHPGHGRGGPHRQLARDGRRAAAPAWCSTSTRCRCARRA